MIQTKQKGDSKSMTTRKAVNERPYAVNPPLRCYMRMTFLGLLVLGTGVCCFAASAPMPTLSVAPITFDSFVSTHAHAEALALDARIKTVEMSSAAKVNTSKSGVIVVLY